MAQYYIGIDIGGTNVKVGVFDVDMKVVCKSSIPTESHMGAEDVVNRIIEKTKKLFSNTDADLESIVGVGIGTPGPADYPAGVLYKLANLPKFHNTPLRDMIATGLGCGAIMENDANVACWAEFSAGVGKGAESIVLFTLGTGIGGGIVNDGELVTGCEHNAAELGHVIIFPDGRQCNCGQRGCVEAYASAPSTVARAKEAIEAGAESSLKTVLQETGEITCKDLYDHLKSGDNLAKEVTDLTAKSLAIMCVNMLHVIEPSRIVFSGGVIAAGDVLLDRIKYYFHKHLWKLKTETMEICFATLGEDTGIIGAAALAKHANEQGKLIRP